MICIQKSKTSLVKHIFIILSKCPHLSSKSGKFSVKQIQTTLDVDFFFAFANKEKKSECSARKFFQPLRMWGNCSIIYWYFVLHCTKSCNKLQYQFCGKGKPLKSATNEYIYVLKIFIRFCGVFFMAEEKSVSEATISSLLQQTAKNSALRVLFACSFFSAVIFCIFFFLNQRMKKLC